MIIRYAILLVLITGAMPSAFAMPASGQPGFDNGKVPFAIRIGNVDIAYREFAWFSLPGARVKLTSTAPLEIKGEGIRMDSEQGAEIITAPAQVGVYPIQIVSAGSTISLNLFVMRPTSDMVDGRLGAYRIGQYQQKAFRGLEAYSRPKGFVEVLREHRDLAVSPHFRLSQFLSKQASGWPKYLLLRPELLVKLERLLERVNLHGIRADTFTVMSGYRTPWYNRAIGNRTTSSRHLYGGAADIFIDVDPQDGVMDDLNGDGRISKADAHYLYDLFEDWSSMPWFRRFSGGLGAYGSTSAHGPFVHVDARGYRARWGR